MPGKRSAVRRLSFWIPAGIFLVSGVGKVIDPSGTMPRALAEAGVFLPYAAWLRVLGVIEAVLAVALVLPRFRRPAAYGAVVLLVAFSGFLALNAHDEAFMTDCGCLGAVAATATTDAFAFAVVRNALMCGLLACGVYLLDSERDLREALAHAGMIGVVLLLAALYVGERVRGESAREQVRAMDEGAGRSLRIEWTLPDFELVAADGRGTHSAAAFRGGDHILLFRPTCEYCARLAPSLAALDRKLRERGSRLVLLSLGEGDRVPAFKRTHGCDGIVHFVALSPVIADRLGFQGVPQGLVLDAERRVAFHEGRGRGGTFADALRACGAQIEGLERGVWNRIVERAFGAGYALVGELPGSGTIRSAPVRGSDGAGGHLVVLQSRRSPAHSIEVAVALGPDDVVVDLVILSAGDYQLRFAESRPDVGPLRGLTLPALRAAVGQRADVAGLEARFWRELADIIDNFGRSRRASADAARK